MAFTSNCPKCQKQILVPDGVCSDAVVQCPLCSGEYSLGEIFAAAPPALIVVHPGNTGAAAADGAFRARPFRRRLQLRPRRLRRARAVFFGPSRRTLDAGRRPPAVRRRRSPTDDTRLRHGFRWPCRAPRPRIAGTRRGDRGVCVRRGSRSRCGSRRQCAVRAFRRAVGRAAFRGGA